MESDSFSSFKIMRVHKPDYVFLVFVAVLLFFGLWMLFSASAADAYAKFKDSYFFVRRQVVFGVIPGLALFYFSFKIDYHRYLKFSKPLFLSSLLLLLLALIPGFGASHGTVKSWLVFGGFSFQPAELTKLALILYLAAWLYQLEKKDFDWQKRVLPLLTILAILAILLLKQPDFGTLSILIFIALVVYFVSGNKLSYLAWILSVGAVGVAILILISPYRLARFTSFLNPEADPQGIGYQINQSYLAVGSGGFWGLGWGYSRQKFQYLPEVRADAIFPVIAEELGFIGSVCFLVILGIIFWRGIRIAQNAPDKFGKLIAAGTVSWLIGQSFINIGSMIGVLPLTGLPLPLVSHGGSAAAAMLWALGITANISRQTKER